MRKIKYFLLTFLLFIVTSHCVFADDLYKYEYSPKINTVDFNRIRDVITQNHDELYYIIFGVCKPEESNFVPDDMFRVYLVSKKNFKINNISNDGFFWNIVLKANYYDVGSVSLSNLDYRCNGYAKKFLNTGEQSYKQAINSSVVRDINISGKVLSTFNIKYKNLACMALLDTNCPELKKVILNNCKDENKDNDKNNDINKNSKCECPKFLKPILDNLREINNFLKNKKDTTDNEYLIKIYSVLQNSISKSILDISSTTKQIIDRLTDFQNRFEHLLEEVKKFHMDFKSFSNKIDERLKFISEQMTTLDHDDDHPDQYSILITTQQILNYLQEHLRDLKVEVSGNSGGSSGSSDGGGSSGSSSTIPTDDVYAQHNGWLSKIHNDMTNANDYLDQMLQSMGKNFTIKLIGGFQEVQKDYSKYLETIIKKLDIIIDLLKNMIGNKKDLENSIDNMQDAFKDLMDQPIFDNKDTQKAFNDTYSSFNGSKKFPTLSAEFMPGVKLKYFDLSPFTGLMHTIRDILEAILWISLFLYMIRVFIPKLKI